MSINITDNKETEAIVQKRENELRAFFDLAAVGMAQAEPPTGKFIRVNEKFCEITGYTADELCGMKIAELTHPEDREQDSAAFARMLQDKSAIYNVEKRYVRKDGRIVWVQATANVLRDEQGRPTRTAAVVLDITNRKEAEDALRRSENRFRNIFNNQFQFTAILSPAGVLLDVNDLPLRAAGLKREQVVGKLFWETAWWDELPDMQAGWAARLAHAAQLNEPVFSEDRYRAADGQIRTADASITAVKEADGQVNFFIVQATDTTDRKRSEKEVEASERRYRALTDAMPQLVWAADKDGSHFYYNQQWYDFTGLSVEESLGFGFTNALHPDDKERALKRWERAWKAGERYEIEYRFYSRPHNEYRWFLGRATPVRNAEGVITQWVGTCTDINEQKRLASELERANAERERIFDEVSTPVVPVWDGIVVMPLVGSLDTRRMEQATNTALNYVRTTNAHSVIIDITGARLIDSHAIANLTNLISALKLIGTDAIVTGVTAQAARSFVYLGVDLTQLTTRRTLAEALSSIINHQIQSPLERLNRTAKYIQQGTTTSDASNTDAQLDDANSWRT